MHIPPDVHCPGELTVLKGASLLLQTVPHVVVTRVVARFPGERLLETAPQKLRVAQHMLRGIGSCIRRVNRNDADILSRQLLAGCLRDEIQSCLARAISDQARNSGSAGPN
jgi:hypothetical protein